MIAAFRSGTDLRRFALFLAAGGINTLFGYAAFALLIWLGTGNTMAVVLGTSAGILFNFNTFGRVFAARGLSRLPHFIGIYAVFMAANAGLLHLLTQAGLGPFLGEALVVAALAPCSFLAMRSFVFNVPAETAP